MGVTLRDVAARANVSVGTASMILNGKEREVRISAATRTRVLKVAEELKYQPNSFARSLRTQKSNTLGVCAAYLMDPYTATILHWANHAAHARQYKLMLSFLEEQEEPADAIREIFGKGTVDGILVRESGFLLDDQSIISLHKQGMHMVLIGREVEGYRIPTVLLDNFRGGWLAAEHLMSLGHKKIGLMMYDHPEMGVKRALGAKAALSQAGFDMDQVIERYVTDRAPSDSTERGQDLIAELLENGERPTAIIAGADILAFRIIRAITNQGLRVPEDIAVVGFDDMEYISVNFNPPLTSVRPPYTEMGELGANLLMDIIEGKTDSEIDNRFVLEPTLVVRESSDGKNGK
jgi:DNA-binding LacI/PurR family transcriptional regulator